jgi:integrase
LKRKRNTHEEMTMAAHKMKDGRWCEWLRLGSDPATGKPIRRRVEAKTKRETEMKAKALRERHDRGENVLDKARTLGVLLDDWIATMERQGLAENTMVSYRGVIKNHLTPHMGATLVPKLRARDIQKVFNELADRFASSTVRSIKTVLVAALDLAIEQNERSDNPAARIRVPAVKPTPGRSLSPDEVRAVLLQCEGRRYGLAIQLALLGLRRGEIPGLRWEDFDELAGTLLIRRQIQRVKKQWVAIPPKDGSARMLSLGPKMTALLRQHRWNMAEERDAMEWPNSGYIFVSVQTGGVCPPGTIYNAFKAIAKAAGAEPARLHDCRHTAGTKLLSEGEDIATVAEVLGHASPLVTARVYSHALPHKVAGASRRLEDLYE